MGKDSLLKSTSKKQTATKAKKKNKPEKKAAAAGHKGKATAKIPKKATVAKKTTGTAKTKSTIKARAASTPAVTKTGSRKKVSKEKLVFRKFKTWKPKKIFRPEPDITYLQNFVAPPLVSDENAKAAIRIKKLLFKKFDSTTLSEKKGDSEPPRSPSAAETEHQPPIEISETPAYTKRLDPTTKMLVYIATGFIIIVALVISASVSNRSNYYIKATDGAVEIWRGRFAPVGIERIIFLAGAQAPETSKAVYTESEIHTFAFNYYLERADTLLEVPGMPDFEGIKLYLNLALSYGITDDLRKAAYDRLNNIDLMIYLYKADVAASKGTMSEYKIALGYLENAAALNLDKAKTELVRKKIESIQDLIQAHESKAGKTPATPSETPVLQKKEALNPAESTSK